MPERIVNILRGFRRRLVAVRAAEAAAVAATVSALAAASLMAARILAGQFPATSTGLCALPLAAAMVLAAWPGLRKVLGPGAWLPWALAALLSAMGVAAAAALAAGVFPAVPKNALVLLVPACAAAAAVVAMVRGAPMDHVVMGLDRQAGLHERLSTAWELRHRSDDASFIRAVHDQAAVAVTGGRLAGVRFWTRTRATLGALGLALMSVAVMVGWTPLESPSALRQRRWRQVAPPAGDVLQAELAAVLARSPDAPEALASALRRLEALADRLRSAEPDEAKRWDGQVLELEQVARALRRFLRDGQADAETQKQLRRLLRAIEQVAVDVAAGMGGVDAAGRAGGADRPADPETVKLPASTDRPPKGWTSVYSPEYERLVDPATTPAGDNGDDPAPAPSRQAPYDRQWMLARTRAAEAVQARDVPWEYRQLVRDFFATGP